jgi:hypothetical protein
MKIVWSNLNNWFYGTVILIIVLFAPESIYCQDTAATSAQDEINQLYKIEKPGTITFTVGVKIRGKVEKPQVIIFLPKEKSIYKEHVLDRSFSAELSQPLDFEPLIE